MDSLLVEEHGNTLVIKINRPQVRNAINSAVASALADALDELDGNDDFAVGVLTGTGDHFSAGMDLKAFLDGEVPWVPGRGFAGLTEAPPRKPLLAAVEGSALAGGFELVLACDMVVAGRGSRFGTPEVRRALVAAAGGALVLPTRIPMAIALEMLLTGQPINAERAEQVGLVNYVVDEGRALSRAMELATVIGANGPLALQASKAIARATSDWTSTTKWEEQRKYSDPVFSSEDAKEGAAAFLEKREPRWQGQ